MPASADLLSAPTVFDRLRTELADLAFDLERQGRLDAADVVMQLDARVRELAGGESLEGRADRPGPPRFTRDMHALNGAPGRCALPASRD